MGMSLIEKPHAMVSQTISHSTSPKVISSEMLACQLLAIQVMRYGYMDSIVLDTYSIKSGTTTNGTKLNYSNNVITMKINSDGTITLSGTGADELNISIVGIT